MSISLKVIPVIKLYKDYVLVLDQRYLPTKVIFRKIKNVSEMADAIKKMVVRGAPLIGISAAFALCLAVRKISKNKINDRLKEWKTAVNILNSSRPTAVNLFTATSIMNKTFQEYVHASYKELVDAVENKARELFNEDLEMSKRIGKIGSSLVKDNTVWLTHCNAGGLATSGLGTALAVFYEAKKQGKNFTVFVDETRPLFQGSRLTAWELCKAKIKSYVISDSAACFAIKTKKITGIITGADRIAANGDTANKIGTFSLAVISNYFGIPFYVAVPSTTFDLSISSGDKIPIEERDEKEIRCLRGINIVTPEAKIWNPAFDITPGNLISGFITDRGLIKPPYVKRINDLFCKTVNN